MKTDYKECRMLTTNNVVILVPGNKENKIHGTILDCVADLDKNLKRYNLNDEMIEELKKQVQYLFQEGCHYISLIQSENCKDIIVLAQELLTGFFFNAIKGG